MAPPMRASTRTRASLYIHFEIRLSLKKKRPEFPRDAKANQTKTNIKQFSQTLVGLSLWV